MLGRLRDYLWYEGVFWVSLFVGTLLFSLRVTGRRNFPLKGPVLLLANHQSYIDPFLVGLCCRVRHPSYLARRSLQRNPLLARFLRSMHMVPIDQEGLGKEGLQAALKLLGAGEVVVVFPEGTRTEDGRLQPLRPGVALLIKRAKVPVLPIGIAGAYDAWPRWRKYPWPAPMSVAVGPLIAPERFEGMSREQILELLAGEIKRAYEQANRLAAHLRCTAKLYGQVVP
jgi:1-acyl-sn-glycerol-3-phosphate acyltransferase